jgi:arsenate reductase
MSMAASRVTIYHNPRCRTSRTVLEAIRQQGIEPEIVHYLDTPPTAAELKKLIDAAGIRPIDLVRRKEPIAKELGIGTRDYSDRELIQLMADHPILIERPLVVKGKRAVLARPPERLQELL